MHAGNVSCSMLHVAKVAQVCTDTLVRGCEKKEHLKSCYAWDFAVSMKSAAGVFLFTAKNASRHHCCVLLRRSKVRKDAVRLANWGKPPEQPLSINSATILRLRNFTLAVTIGRVRRLNMCAKRPCCSRLGAHIVDPWSWYSDKRVSIRDVWTE